MSGGRQQGDLEASGSEDVASVVIAEPLAELVVPIGSVKPFPGNPRRGDLPALVRSLEVNGQYRPIVVNRRTGEVLAGNHTLAAALELGWDGIAATFVDVGEVEARRIVLADNRTAELGGYDDGELAAMLQHLPDFDGTGWRPSDLGRLLDRLDRDESDDTEPMPLPADATARRGDLWQLGEHRLVCGDATDADDVALLLDDDELDMVWTDPPWGVDYVGKTPEALTMRADHAGDDLEQIVRVALEHAIQATRPGGAIYLVHAAGGSDLGAAATAAGWDLRQTLVWVKQTFVLSRQDYHWQHEAIHYGWRPGAAHRWNADRTETTVFDDEVDVANLNRRELIALIRHLRNERRTTVVREDKPSRADLHPTTKPVGLVARHVVNSSRRGEVVLDPFGGSGSTLLACENTVRSGRLLEIDPRYCDVIVDRWERHTGQKAERQ